MTATFIPVIQRSTIIGFARQSVNDGPWLALTFSGVPMVTRVFETSEAAANYIERRDQDRQEYLEKWNVGPFRALTDTQPIPTEPRS